MATKKNATASSKKKAAKKTAKSTKSTTAKKVVKKAVKTAPEKKTPEKKAAKKATKKTKTIAKKPVASSSKKTDKVTTKKTTANAKSTSTSRASKSTAKKERVVADPVKYEPNPSLLDTPKTAYTPGRRYSDADLQEFKELIQGKLEAARKEVSYLQGLITRKGESGTDDTESKLMGVEDGSGTMEREQISQLASRQIQFIDKLEKALMRIENKTYGICRVTGKLIDKERLRAVPHATLSIEAKQSRKK